MPDPPAPVPAEPVLLSVGAVADRLGVAPSTVRSWGRRYGLVPAGRTTGGHRRFTLADLDALARIQQLIADGASRVDAANTVLGTGHLTQPADGGGAPTTPAPPRQSSPRGTGRSVQNRLVLPADVPTAARRLARLAADVDPAAISAQLIGMLTRTGLNHTWLDVCVPVLQALGDQWARTGRTIEIEHALSEAIIDALKTYRAGQPAPVAARPVLLACASSDQHTLALHVLAGALAERRTPIRVLGSRTPTAALAHAARRTDAAGVFLWRQLSEPIGDDEDWTPLTRLTASSGDTARVTLVAGGPGWHTHPLPRTVHHVQDLPTAVHLLQAS